MYGYRNNSVRNFILTFLAGWLFGQVFTIQPKAFSQKNVVDRIVEQKQR